VAIAGGLVRLGVGPLGIITISVLGVRDAEIGDVGYTTVEVRFTGDVNSPTADYVSGVTIRVNAIVRGIASGTRQPDNSLVYYVLVSQVDVNDTLTWEYDSLLGDMEDAFGNPLGDVPATGCSNWVGSHLYFDTEDDCVWVAAV